MPAGTTLSDRDPSQPAWRDAPHPAWQLTRMQAYAAQIDRMDRGIGRIVAALAETGALENTLFLFLSDNGASAEPLPIADVESFRRRRSIVPPSTWAGAPLRIGNSPDIEPGPEDTYASYGRAWANLSNTPFRLYKRWVHEGGISTPLIVHWPAGGLGPRIVDAAFQLTDVVPTVLEATGVEYPAAYQGYERLPARGPQHAARAPGRTRAGRHALLGAHRQHRDPARALEARARARAAVGALRHRRRSRRAGQRGGAAPRASSPSWRRRGRRGRIASASFPGSTCRRSTAANARVIRPPDREFADPDRSCLTWVRAVGYLMAESHVFQRRRRAHEQRTGSA